MARLKEPRIPDHLLDQLLELGRVGRHLHAGGAALIDRHLHVAHQDELVADHGNDAVERQLLGHERARHRDRGGP